jgi:anti-sigma factor RsiW
MKYEHSHLSGQQLLLDVDGELPPRDEKVVRAHFDGCWKCRARRQELDNTIADFIRLYQKESDAKLPPVAGRRKHTQRIAKSPFGKGHLRLLCLLFGSSPAAPPI